MYSIDQQHVFEQVGHPSFLGGGAKWGIGKPAWDTMTVRLKSVYAINVV